MSCCCNADGGRKTPMWGRRAGGFFAWALPSAGLALVPKCPACLAAYVTLWTGLGLSLSTAAWLRWGLVALCGGSLLVLALNEIDRRLAAASRFKSETGR